jgi:RNA polymerase sigma-70 factor (ECF subfamily)
MSVDRVSEQVEFARRIYETYGEFLFRVIRFRVRDDAMARDVLQDLFVKLIAKPPRGVINLRAYLFRAGTLEALNALRQAKRRTAREQEYGRGEQEVSGDTRAPVQTLGEDEEIERMLTLINRHLSPREATAVTLRLRDDCSYEEAGRKMGITGNSVKRYVSVGLRKLRGVLADGRDAT